MLTSHTERNTGPWVGNATFPLENGCLTEGIMLRTFILGFTLKNSYSEEIKFAVIWKLGFPSFYPHCVINKACWWPTRGNWGPPSPLQHSVSPGLKHAVRRQQMQRTQFTCQKPDVQKRVNCCGCAPFFPAQPSWSSSCSFCSSRLLCLLVKLVKIWGEQGAVPRKERPAQGWAKRYLVCLASVQVLGRSVEQHKGHLKRWFEICVDTMDDLGLWI